MQDMQLYREKLAIKKVQKNKKNIVSELYSWAGTFDCRSMTKASHAQRLMTLFLAWQRG